jgi:hypothetical protein
MSNRTNLPLDSRQPKRATESWRGELPAIVEAITRLLEDGGKPKAAHLHDLCVAWIDAHPTAPPEAVEYIRSVDRASVELARAPDESAPSRLPLTARLREARGALIALGQEASDVTLERADGRPRRRADDYSPRGDGALLEDVRKALARFGDPAATRPSPGLDARIEAIATHFNRLNSKAYKPPTYAEVEGVLAELDKAAAKLAALLGKEKLGFVPMAWLTGGALPLGVALGLEHILSPFRFRPAQTDAERSDRVVGVFDGPRDLLDDKHFVPALETAFGPQFKALAQRVGVNSPFDRRADLIDPLAGQITALSEVAARARREFSKQWPKQIAKHRNSNALALTCSQYALAEECWSLVVDIHGRQGFEQITTTPHRRDPSPKARGSEMSQRRKGGALFGELVQAMARYAMGGEGMGDASFDRSIKAMANKGREIVARYERDGRDFFAVRDPVAAQQRSSSIAAAHIESMNAAALK